MLVRLLYASRARQPLGAEVLDAYLEPKTVVMAL